MAKGNMFLGMARGSVGDVTFYRNNGQQTARVRNRNPRNPRTNPQLFQRAIMATVVQAYAAGKEIFDHSFQGFSVGAGCQREFLRRNTHMLRELVGADINTPIVTAQQKARIVAPGVSVPTPNPFIISRGSYDQKLFTLQSATTGYTIAQPTSKETVANYANRLGLIAGDIYTFVAFKPTADLAYSSPIYDDAYAQQNYCTFIFVRMQVKDGLSENNDELAEYSQLFDFEVRGFDNWDPDAPINANLGPNIGDSDSLTSGAYGIIRSRKDMDVRSDSQMVVSYGSGDSLFGIVPDYLLDTWSMEGSSLGNSKLILEGGNG